MTTTLTPPRSGPDRTGGAPPPPRPAPVPRHQPGPASRTVGTALIILAVLLLAVVAEAGPLGTLQHSRDRQVDYAVLRAQLAAGTAPVSTATSEGVTPLAPGVPMAVLHIPGIRLREVVREGTTAGQLARGPGHRRDTPLPGQAGTSVVFARQAMYGGSFRRLKELLPGEEFTVVTGQSERPHRYRVTAVRRAGDPQPPVLADGKGRLMLVTADGTPFLPTDVLRVDADLVSAPVPGAKPAVAPGALPAEERAMGAQESAWMPLVLWLQGLALAVAALVWIRTRLGRGHAWLIGLPALAALSLAAADAALMLLPNLL
ncbi:sortase [Streptomyces polyrhachis]|uniref:Sortase n=1 Tax=Streptomyces polyrhachis TaxID=1282885 RepID=A0ABW2GGN2_9ACTN